MKNLNQFLVPVFICLNLLGSSVEASPTYEQMQTYFQQLTPSNKVRLAYFFGFGFEEIRDNIERKNSDLYRALIEKSRTRLHKVALLFKTKKEHDAYHLTQNMIKNHGTENSDLTPFEQKALHYLEIANYLSPQAVSDIANFYDRETVPRGLLDQWKAAPMTPLAFPMLVQHLDQGTPGNGLIAIRNLFNDYFPLLNFSGKKQAQDLLNQYASFQPTKIPSSAISPISSARSYSQPPLSPAASSYNTSSSASDLPSRSSYSNNYSHSGSSSNSYYSTHSSASPYYHSSSSQSLSAASPATCKTDSTPPALQRLGKELSSLTSSSQVSTSVLEPTENAEPGVAEVIRLLNQMDQGKSNCPHFGFFALQLGMQVPSQSPFGREMYTIWHPIMRFPVNAGDNKSGGILEYLINQFSSVNSLPSETARKFNSHLQLVRAQGLVGKGSCNGEKLTDDENLALGILKHTLLMQKRARIVSNPMSPATHPVSPSSTSPVIRKGNLEPASPNSEMSNVIQMLNAADNGEMQCAHFDHFAMELGRQVQSESPIVQEILRVLEDKTMVDIPQERSEKWMGEPDGILGEMLKYLPFTITYIKSAHLMNYIQQVRDSGFVGKGSCKMGSEIIPFKNEENLVLGILKYHLFLQNKAILKE